MVHERPAAAADVRILEAGAERALSLRQRHQVQALLRPRSLIPTIPASRKRLYAPPWSKSSANLEYTLDILPWLLIPAAVLLYLWHSDPFKTRARELATRHCSELGLQLLDQSVVIRGLWPERGESGRWQLRRTYHFEFASVGDRRYQGVIIMLGMHPRSIELEAYRLPDD